MTIEKLLNLTADELEKMTDVELQKYFEPVLKWTHVDKVAKPKTNTINVKQHTRKQAVNDRVQAILKLYGEQNKNS